MAWLEVPASIPFTLPETAILAILGLDARLESR
jgi:hypothetical protein